VIGTNIYLRELYLSKHVLITLTGCTATPNSMRILYNTAVIIESWGFLNADVLSHCTPTFLQYLMYALHLVTRFIGCVETHANDLQQFHLHMESTLKKILNKISYEVEVDNCFTVFCHPSK
jgi:hypothetical protein